MKIFKKALVPLFAALSMFCSVVEPASAVSNSYLSVCGNNAINVVVPGPGQLIPGRYYNPRRSGQGWDFFWYGNLEEAGAPSTTDKLFVTFYTYEFRDGLWKPAWYGATFDPAAGSAANFGFTLDGSGSRTRWDGVLYRYDLASFAGGNGPIRQVNPSTATGTTASPAAQAIGRVTLYFGSNGITPGMRPDQVAAEWQLTNTSLHPLDATYPADLAIPNQDCLSNVVASQMPAGQPESGKSGVWSHENSAAGWFWSPVFWVPTEPAGSPVAEHHLLSFFDASNRPSWILAGDNTHVCSVGSTYPPVEPAPDKAVCAMRSHGYEPRKLLCDASNQPAGCARWNSTDYLIRVGKLVRGPWTASVGGVNRTTLNIVRQIGALPTGSLNGDTSALSVAMTAATQGSPSVPMAPFDNVVSVSQLVGLTRLRVDDVRSEGDADACVVGPVGSTGQGLCDLRVHFMTEGAHPGLTIVRERVSSAGEATDDVHVVRSGLLRSPVDGLPFPASSASPAPGEAILVGDRFRFVALASESLATQLPLAELFKTRDLFAVKASSTYCPSANTSDLTQAPTIQVLPNAAAGQPFRVTAVAESGISRPVLGIRLRIYSMVQSVRGPLAAERIVPLNLRGTAVDQTITVSGLAPGVSYVAKADLYNHCNVLRYSAPTYVQQDFEVPDDAQFNSGWTPGQTSDGNLISPVAGAIPLQVEASGGSAAVSVPVEVAPGRHGMQPQISLSYSSRGGNGIAGMGWGLNGTSSIHRCPRTSDQDDNRPGGVELSNNDRLCLDGQRLVAVAGAYGNINAEYRTEVDQFIRIKQRGGGDIGGTGVQFLVEYGNGQTAVYGDLIASSNSRVDVQVGADTRTLSWQLSRRQDGAGNSITYLYNTAGAVGSGESLLTQIQYTGFVNSTGGVHSVGNRSVTFCYEDRPGATAPSATNPCIARESSIWNGTGSDRGSSYLAGALIEQTKRLRTITVTAEGAQVRRYELNYAAPSAYSGRSLLREVLVCGINSASCLPKTVFAWNERAGPRLDFRRLSELDTLAPLPNPEPEPGVAFDPTDSRPYRFTQDLGDVDGDGLDEMLVTDRWIPFSPFHPSKHYVARWHADRSAAGQVFEVPASWSMFSDQNTHWDDLNNDGRADAFYFEKSVANCTEYIYQFDATVGGEYEDKVRECDGTYRLRIGTYTGDLVDWTPASFSFQTNTFAGDPTNSGLLEATKSAESMPFRRNGVVIASFGFGDMNDAGPVASRTRFVDVNGDELKDLLIARHIDYNDPDALACRVSGHVGEQTLGVLKLQVFPNISARGGTQFRFGGSAIYQSCLEISSAWTPPSFLPARLTGPFRVAAFPDQDLDGDGLVDIQSVSISGRGRSTPRVHFGRLNGAGVTPGSGVLGWGNLLQSSSDPLVATISQLGPGMADENWWGQSKGSNQIGVLDTEALRAVTRLDVNGDGLQDIAYGTADPREQTVFTHIRLNTGRQGNQSTLYTAPIEIRSPAGTVGVPVSPAGGARFNVPHDLDSDGRPEILSPGTFAARLCTLLYVRTTETRYSFVDDRGTLAEDQTDGLDDLTPILDDFYFCPGTAEHGSPALRRGTYLNGVPTREMYANGWGSLDSSLYFAKAHRFVEQHVNGVLQYQLVALGQTDLVTNARGATSDVFRDGLSDARMYFGCRERRGQNVTGKRCEIPTHNNVSCPGADEICRSWTPAPSYGPLTLPNGTRLVEGPPENGTTIDSASYGAYITENLGTLNAGVLPAGTAPPLPELLASVSQRSQTATPLKQWQFSYQPLSSSAGRMPGELPLYEVPSTGLRGTAREKHFYFTSSMPVVSTYTETINGGSGERIYQRTHSLGYREALFNNAGRGFRGFRDIIEETDAITVTGSLLPGTRTLTRFEHYFPMSGLVSCRVTTSSLSELSLLECPLKSVPSGSTTSAKSVPIPGPGIIRPGLMSDEVRSYITSTSGGRYVVQPSTVATQVYDPSQGRRVSISSSTSSDYDSYGHPTVQTSQTTDFLGAPLSDRTRSSEVRTLYDPLVSTGLWWPDRPVRTMQSSSTMGNSATVLSTQSNTALIGYDSTTRQPNCQMQFEGARTVAVSLATACTDPGASGPGWASSAKTSFDVFGNASSTTQYIKDAAQRTGSSQWCSGTACAAGNLDGYFPLSTANAAGHPTCSTFDARYGVATMVRQPMTTTGTCATPGGMTTTVTLDGLGSPIQQSFPTATDAQGQLAKLSPPQHTARQWCSIVPPRCPAIVSAAVMREVVEQQGAPTSYRFLDGEGRAVAESTERFESGNLRYVYRSYDDFGRLLRESQPTLDITTPYNTDQAYDEYGRPIAKWTTRARLDGAAGNVATLTSYIPDGLRTGIEVSKCSSVTAPAQPGEVPTCNGQDGSPLTMSRWYSSDGKVLLTRDADGHDTKFQYDGGGNVSELTDANSQRTTAIYDGLGRRLSSQDPNQGARNYTYNGVGELMSETDARGWITNYSYDLLGRIVQRSWKEQSVAQNTNGSLNRDNGVDSFTYDTLGAGILSEQRRTLTSASSGLVLEKSVTTYAVDNLYRGVRSEQSIRVDGSDQTFTSTTRYDRGFGRVKQVSYPGGVSVVYRYNARGFALGEALLEHYADPNQYLRRVDATDAFGNATSISLSSGAMKRLQKTDASTGWVTRICSGTGSFTCAESTAINNARALDVSYRYNGFGNISGATNAGLKSPTISAPIVESYSYDNLHRLIQTTGPTPVSYAYDAVGNILKKTDFSQNPVAGNAYVYGMRGGPNAVSEVALLDPPAGCTQANARANYWYDANGNQVGRQVGCSGQTQTASDWMDYSIDNLPRQIARMPAVSFGTQPNPATIPVANNLTRFHYGPDGQRTLQSLTFDANNNRRVTVYAGAYERDTYAGPSNPGGVSRVEHRYAIAPGVLLVKNPTDSQRSGVHYVHTDRLGSTSTVTRSDGSLVSQNGFDAFGMPRSADWGKPAWGWTMADTANGAGFSNPSITRRGFTDHEQLDQLGLTHMNGRMYDYRLGRFLGVDPIIQFPTNSQSLNPYSYVLNNPLSGTDPTGYATCPAGTTCNSEITRGYIKDPRQRILERQTVTTTDPNGTKTVTGVHVTADSNGGYKFEQTSQQKTNGAESQSTTDTQDRDSTDQDISEIGAPEQRLANAADAVGRGASAAGDLISPCGEPGSVEKCAGIVVITAAGTYGLVKVLRSMPALRSFAAGLMRSNGNNAAAVKIEAKIVSTRGAEGAADAAPGSFSIADWVGYPPSVPKPQGPFRILEGAEYESARDAANAANRSIRREQGLVGQPVDVHEIHPVKFNGSPTESSNKTILDRDVHRKEVTPWWNKLQKDLQSN